MTVLLCGKVLRMRMPTVDEKPVLDEARQCALG